MKKTIKTLNHCHTYYIPTPSLAQARKIAHSGTVQAHLHCWFSEFHDGWMGPFSFRVSKTRPAASKNVLRLSKEIVKFWGRGK